MKFNRSGVIGKRLRPERGKRSEAAPPSASEREPSARASAHAGARSAGGGAPAPREGWGPASRKRSWQNVASISIVTFAVLVVAGCRQDMHNQPKYRPLRASSFFPDGSSARPLVEGTVARGTLQEDVAFFTGKVGTQLVKELPFPVTKEVLDRGQQRFDIFCAPCHDRTGSGNGMIVQRGYRQPPSMHIDRLRNVESGHFFDIMTNGFGAMPDYKVQITARDRWNIVAYIRALQLSQHSAAADVPGGDPTKVQSPVAGERRH